MSKDSNKLSTKNQSGRVRWIGYSAVLSTLIAVFALRLTPQPSVAQEQIAALPVRVQTVNIQDGYNAKRSFTGRAVSKQTSNLSFELTGILSTIAVDLGSEVKAGDLLAKINTDRLQARLREINAELSEAEANSYLADRTLKRAKQVFESGHATAQRLDEAEANAIAVNARMERLKAARDTIKLDLKKSELKAPYDGTITARNLDTGSVITAGTHVLEITESGSMEARIGMPPEFAAAIKSGAPVRLLDNRRKTIDKKSIRSIVPVIDGQTRTMMITFNIAENTVTRGELLTAIVEDWQEQSGAWIPLRALAADVRGLWRVYKIINVPNGHQVKFENVQVLYTDGNRVFVTGTLSDGDRIISDGVNRLAPGQNVNIVPALHHQAG